MSDQVPVAAGLGRAVPPEIEHERLWTDYFAAQYAAAGARRLRAAERIWRSVGVRTRHAAVDPRREDVASWPTSVRMRRFLAEVLPLGKAAVTDALADAGVSAGDAGLFVVATCTGYGTPGPDILLARDLGMPAQVQRLLVGHMGCYAALPGLAAAADHVRAHGRPAVLLAVELPSLHVQPAVGD
ncbi:MAG TPA: hypothetical protein VNE21_05290, partial [Mycobacteriales bacterium]|nr:hypothetical protein [Mycobacteriales bacterium]